MKITEQIRAGSGSAEDINNVGESIKGIYHFSNISGYYQADLPNLREFKSRVVEVKEKEPGKIKKYSLELLEKLLDEKIKLISVEE